MIRYKLPPAIPQENTYPLCFAPLFIPVREENAMDVFLERDRAVVGRFRRSKKIELRGQVSLDV